MTHSKVILRLEELTTAERKALPWWDPTSDKQLAVRSEPVVPVDGAAYAYVQDIEGNWYRRAW